MADKKISALSLLNELSGEERMPVAKDGKNYAVLVDTLREGLVGPDGARVLAEALCQIRTDIDNLRASLNDLGNAKGLSFDSENGYMVCGQKLVDVVEGAPTEIPLAVGLFRFDKNTKTMYVNDQVTNSTKDWKIIS